MELHRILARDHRSAIDEATTRFGKDVLIVSTQTVNGMTELVVAQDNPVAVDLAAPTPSQAQAQQRAGENFADAFRKALDPMPAKPPAAPARVLSPSATHAETVAALKAAKQQAHSGLQGPQGADWESLQDVLQQVRQVVAPATTPTLSTAEAVGGLNRAALGIDDRAAEAPRHAASHLSSSAPSPTAPVGMPLSADAGRGQELVDLVRSELAALRQEVSLSRQMHMWPQQQSVPAGVEPLVQALHEVGVPAALRALLTDGLRHVHNTSEGFVQLREQLVASLESVREVPDVGRGVHALCGPTGAGKSHMAVRLARAATQLYPADQVALIAFNDQRCGAWSQLQVLSAQAGVSCYRARDASSLRLLLDELSEHALVMIDTAGADGLSQREALASLPQSVTCHAVLPADASMGMLRRWCGTGQAWDSFMVTKLDESDHPWALIQHLCDYHTPVSAMSQSPNPQANVTDLESLNLIECGMQRLRTECEALSPIGQAAALIPSGRAALSVVPA